MPSTTKSSFVGDLQLLHDEEPELLRHRRLDLESDDAAAPALLQRRLEQADQVLGLLLDLDVADRG